MPLKLDIKQKLVVKSKRVKNVDLHPTEPWVLSALFSGQVVITNYKTKSTVRSFDVSELPVRAGKFIARKRWFICGADDMHIRVFDYNTAEKEAVFEAHSDYIRSISVHATKPYVLTCSDDLQIKMWDWENKWQCVRIFEGHTHYVMMVNFSPKDPNIFASASLDTSVRVWNINKSSANFALQGHAQGVNCVDFYHGDKPFIISGSDDTQVKIWDYQTRSCVQTLEGHSENVTAVCFHPRLGYIISGSEDHTVNIWNSSTYQLEDTLDSGLERVWDLGYANNTKIALAYDEGTVVLRLGKEIPVVSMDRKGKVIWIRNGEVQQVSIKHSAEEESNIFDGEKLVFPTKDKGVSDVTAHNIVHAPKGNYIAFSGENEWVIYSPVTMKNKSYGSGVEIVWGNATGQFAVRERSGKVKIFKSFKQQMVLDTFFTPTGIFGGNALGVKSKDVFCLYDWESGALIQSVEVSPRVVYWNETGDSLVLADDDTWYVLKYDAQVVKKALKSGTVEESGVDDCVAVENEFSEKIKRGYWIGECFIYTNNENNLKYYIGGSTETIAHLDKSYFLLGFISKYNRVYLMDKEYNIVSYQLHVSVMQYEAAIVAGDWDLAKQHLDEVPKEFYNKLAQFLDRQGKLELKEIAIGLTSDPEHKFQLALELNKLDEALEIAQEEQSEQKWRQVGGIALSECKFELAEKCMKQGKDFSGLLLLYSSTGDREGMKYLSEVTRQEGKNNITLVANLLTHDVKSCLDVLVDTKRLPEAAFMARTYMPSEASNILQMWKKDLTTVSEKAADALADPEEYANLFPNFDEAKQVEKQYYESLSGSLPAADYEQYKAEIERDLIAELQQGTLSSKPAEMQPNGDDSEKNTAEHDEEETPNNNEEEQETPEENGEEAS
uniref:Coatomer subunit beta' n=1 Tax=Percolomonas cosmopolitus TaxID=63605 RepID=A0A7S1KUN6_9EUKA|mmetsp:Transcript_9725/g.36154  ORF Transcript_9725/g.36154 Transcript_9725/m.36154 type:complete len:892 (+) Transcript_9725:159-2834(+)|eukprot:CAMPEP_0117442230 /NCGR_PEP_ID=MMETSP0759-20121206/4044_1 /TAXON_ID=63605 /ORGANISM="Percolomonas cosmopolitus, Strain WS" /LENGTH=891 /DNA_ID=CAMNT_0005234111 /DNA_START=176 /DNA_END=2851 /DNA_ORIENTATION=+